MWEVEEGGGGRGRWKGGVGGRWKKGGEEVGSLKNFPPLFHHFLHPLTSSLNLRNSLFEIDSSIIPSRDNDVDEEDDGSDDLDEIVNCRG